MCGIAARVGEGDVVGHLLMGLENLEYRGYDSAGIAIQNGGGLDICKREGELGHLKEEVTDRVLNGEIGIGHTRWSTHGPPTDTNAHPHTDCRGRIAVVHNGIIDNYEPLRNRLTANGHVFTSDTDTEIIPHLVEDRLDGGDTPEEAFRKTIRSLQGSYAVAILIDGVDAIYAARKGSPLILGVDGDTRYLASDIPAFLDYTDHVVYLEDHDCVIITPDGHEITDVHGRSVRRDIRTVDWVAEDAKKGGYEHYMLKEIHEQPAALAQTFRNRINHGLETIALDEFPIGSFSNVTNVQFVACGTSFHAALYASHLLNKGGMPAQTYLANEYVTTPAPTNNGTIVIGVTQSGETADTLESLRIADQNDTRTLAVTNVVGSTAARECDDVMFIRAGPEICVAATKTFSSQIAALVLLGERIIYDATGRHSNDIDEILTSLVQLPGALDTILSNQAAKSVAMTYEDNTAYFFIGRGVAYPVALEGALKFKEITYKHAEGFAAGELKHGPLALITNDTPVIAVFTGDHDGKTLNNVREVKARGAPVIGVTQEPNDAIKEVSNDVLPFPALHPNIAGIAANVQLQLLSYHVANLLYRSIDKPRNLAKSVTVE